MARIIQTVLQFRAYFGSPFDPAIIRAAIIHDLCYSTHVIARKEADVLFKEMLISEEVNFIKVRLFYVGLRLFGKKDWKKTTELDKSKYGSKIKVVNHA